ncbi:LLM class flavin-dependent oxidoreductase [Streptomyces sp. NPDC006487]|uniref:LLM class flavin-dependent oxidoreductase n=1 Tax=Streptomyces sp. NPDC006487 TaxID=3364748 RepID=UPI00367C7559
MAMTVIRFNLVDPEPAAGSLADRYGTALEMAAYADQHGVDTIQTEEHHGAANNWMPAPLPFAGAVLGATRRTTVTISAVLGPLYDPLRLAEDISVLDLVSRGRLVTVVGVGYRPEEYAALGVDFKQRGTLQDELLDTLLAAWTGEEFTYRGRAVRITPRPHTRPHPLLIVGGASKPAARRAARLGLPFFPSAHLPELEAYYHRMRGEYGTNGYCMMPAARTPLLHISPDPDETWARYGAHFLHEARTYASWQSDETHSAVESAAGDVSELRAEGVYQVLTPDEAVAAGLSTYVLHPLCGGMPLDEGWRSIRLFFDRVLPRLAS